MVDTASIPFSEAETILQEVENRICEVLNRIGICYFTHSRVKSARSCEKKLREKATEYAANGKRMQDLMGIRVVLYYREDVEVAHTAIRAAFEQDSEAIDKPSATDFGPTRYNVVFRLPKDRADVFRKHPLLDATVEVQFRTVFSEGWLEVEHDRRYKRKTDWDGQPDLVRLFNGISATLETSDALLAKVLDDLAYQAYLAGNWTAMVSHKFRLRFAVEDVSAPVNGVLEADNKAIGRELFKLDRAQLLRKLVKHDWGTLPMTADLIVFLANRTLLERPELAAAEPTVVKRALDRAGLSPSGPARGPMARSSLGSFELTEPSTARDVGSYNDAV